MRVLQVRDRPTRRALAALALAACVGTPAALHAQGPVALGIGGGVTVPRGELEQVAQRGFHGLATVRLGVPLLPVHARVDAMHGRLDDASGAEGQYRVTSLTGNLGYDVIPLAVASVYVIAGAGWYWSEHSALADERTRTTGWNAGAGLRITLGGVQLFGEARYHSVDTDAGPVRFIPFTAGIIF